MPTCYIQHTDEADVVLTEVCGAFKSPQEASGTEKAGDVEGAVLPCSLAALLSTLSGIKHLSHCPL